MPSAILDGLSLVDTVGHLILATTLAVLIAGIVVNLASRARYASIERDLNSASGRSSFSSSVLNFIVRDAQDAARRRRDVDVQAIVEEHFHARLKSLLLAERFTRAAPGLVIILGLLGTFYGLTLSIGRLVHLVSADAGLAADVSQALTAGLTQALSGMAVAFSNSLVGILSAVILTILGVFSNIADRRNALMIQIETFVDRLVPQRGPVGEGVDGSLARFGESVARLDGVVSRFEQALTTFAASTRDFREFNVRIVASKSHDPK